MFEVFMWIVLFCMMLTFTLKLYEIAVSDKLSSNATRHKFKLVSILALVCFVLWGFIFLSYRENRYKVNEYPKIYVYDSESEYHNGNGTEIYVDYKNSHLNRIKREVVDGGVVITLEFEDN